MISINVTKRTICRGKKKCPKKFDAKAKKKVEVSLREDLPKSESKTAEETKPVESTVETQKEMKWFSLKTLCEIATLGGVVVAIFSFIYRERYKAGCEDFYNIPKEFFVADVNGILMYFVGILGLIFGCLFPWWLKKQNGGKLSMGEKICVIFIPLVYGWVLGMAVHVGLVDVARGIGMWIFQKDWGIYIQERIVFQLSCCFIAIVLVYGLAFADKIKNGCKILSKIKEIFFMILFVLCFTLLLFGTISKVHEGAESKTEYEIVDIEGKEYMVLSETNGKALCVEFTIEDGRYIIYTDKYWLIDRSEGTYRLIEMEYVPLVMQIEKNDIK